MYARPNDIRNKPRHDSTIDPRPLTLKDEQRHGLNQLRAYKLSSRGLSTSRNWTKLRQGSYECVNLSEACITGQQWHWTEGYPI